MALFDLWIRLIAIQLSAETMLTAMGYRKRPAIYGSILFACDEWVKA